MCIVYNVNVDATRSPFEAARSEVDVSEVMMMDIMGLYNKLDYVDWKLNTRLNAVSTSFVYMYVWENTSNIYLMWNLIDRSEIFHFETTSFVFSSVIDKKHRVLSEWKFNELAQSRERWRIYLFLTLRRPEIWHASSVNNQSIMYEGTEGTCRFSKIWER